MYNNLILQLKNEWYDFPYHENILKVYVLSKKNIKHSFDIYRLVNLFAIFL